MVKPRNLAPTDVEHILPPDQYILSTSDLSGRITSVNPLFIEFAGYTETELLNQQHNIVRHPDMPRSVFSLCWDAIADGEEFFGYIKNMRKDGGYYWVFAHILPIRGESGEVVGFRSVRRCPSRTAIEKIEPLYAEMLAAEGSAGARDAIAAGLKVLGTHLAKLGLSYDRLVAKL
ncbi:MAG: PAS domain-containing protein [Azoarcus sp.]|nr:PAS domain-containing protein [Azoarcus sp.]